MYFLIQTTHFSNQAGYSLGASSRQSAVPYSSSFSRPSGSRPEASACAAPDDVPLNLSAPKTSRIQQQPSTLKEEKPLDLSTKKVSLDRIRFLSIPIIITLFSKVNTIKPLDLESIHDTYYYSYYIFF